MTLLLVHLLRRGNMHMPLKHVNVMGLLRREAVRCEQGAVICAYCTCCFVEVP